MVGANKHPQAFGRPAFEVLPEIRAIIEPLLVQVVTTGDPVWLEDLMLPLLRGETQEESYFTFTYSPIRVESGAVGGVLCAVIETTAKLLDARRLRLLNALADVADTRTRVASFLLSRRQMAPSGIASVSSAGAPSVFFKTASFDEAGALRIDDAAAQPSKTQRAQSACRCREDQIRASRRSNDRGLR